MKKKHTAEQIVAKLREAKVLIERWRQHYNRVRPHSSLGYRPPAPEAIVVSLITEHEEFGVSAPEPLAFPPPESAGQTLTTECDRLT